MPDIIVSKAQAVGDEIVPDVDVHIRGELPTYEKLGDLERHCDRDAQKLERALVHSLPGATYGRLLGRMLPRKASHFSVPFDKGGRCDVKKGDDEYIAVGVGAGLLETNDILIRIADALDVLVAERRQAVVRDHRHYSATICETREMLERKGLLAGERQLTLVRLHEYQAMLANLERVHPWLLDARPKPGQEEP